MKSGARKTNKGWRLDYFVASRCLIKELRSKEIIDAFKAKIDEESMPTIISSEIHDEYLGSDHCPVCIEIDFPIDLAGKSQ